MFPSPCREDAMPKALLGQISETLTKAQTTEELTRPLLTLLERVTGLESTYLTHIDEEAGVQSILFARNTSAMQIPEGLSVPWRTRCASARWMRGGSLPMMWRAAGAIQRRPERLASTPM
jgi:GAF domain-containing protein